MRQGHLHLDESASSNGRRTAILEVPGREPFHLWFEAEQRPLAVETGGDPFLIATILHWMRESCNVHVHASVSEEVLAGLTEWQGAWARWLPKTYRSITISADKVRADPPCGTKGIVAFSGGVDASYTVRRHVTGSAGWQTVDIASALLVHGFDIPLGHVASFGVAKQRAQRILDDTNLDLVVLATNLRDLGLEWEHSFGTAVAAALTLLAPRHGIGLIGSGSPYDRLQLPWGSSPMTDQLLSSGLMDIRHDGAGASRTDKIRLLAGWPAATEDLRVCWEAEELGGNCGRCEKCQRTRVSFRLAAIENPRCLPPSDLSLRRLQLRSAGQFSEWESLAAEAYAGGDHRLGRELDALVRKNRMRAMAQNSAWLSLVRGARGQAGRLVRRWLH